MKILAIAESIYWLVGSLGLVGSLVVLGGFVVFIASTGRELWTSRMERASNQRRDTTVNIYVETLHLHIDRPEPELTPGKWKLDRGEHASLSQYGQASTSNEEAHWGKSDD